MSAKGWVRWPGGGLECVSELCIVRSHDCTVDKKCRSRFVRSFVHLIVQFDKNMRIKLLKYLRQAR